MHDIIKLELKNGTVEVTVINNPDGTWTVRNPYLGDYSDFPVTDSNINEAKRKYAKLAEVVLEVYGVPWIAKKGIFEMARDGQL